jgi:hypothetical protein
VFWPPVLVGGVPIQSIGLRAHWQVPKYVTGYKKWYMYDDNMLVGHCSSAGGGGSRRLDAQLA